MKSYSINPAPGIIKNKITLLRLSKNLTIFKVREPKNLPVTQSYPNIIRHKIESFFKDRIRTIRSIQMSRPQPKFCYIRKLPFLKIIIAPVFVFAEFMAYLLIPAAVQVTYTHTGTKAKPLVGIVWIGFKV